MNRYTSHNNSSRPRILVVEDDNDLSWLIKTILEQENFSVERFHSSEGALAKLKTHQYELIISDYRLSTMSGLAFLEEFRKSDFLQPVIMISAYGDITVKARARELGAYAFLDKPFYIEELVKLIKQALKGHSRRCLDERKTESRQSGISSFGDLEPCGLGRHSVA